MGIFGLYFSVLEMVSAFAKFGLRTSGVRQIARAIGSGNSSYAAKCIYILRRIVLLTSLIAALLCVTLSESVSIMVFGSPDKKWGVTLLSLAIFFNGISFGQQTVLTGYRHIRGLALSQTIGGVLGTISTCFLIYYLRENGVVSSIVMVTFFSIITSWWYARKIKLEKVSVTKSEALSEVKELFGLGASFSVAALFAFVANYIIRVYIRDQLGLDEVGIYQAGWTISNLYVGTILGAMGVDFLPRICEMANQNNEINRLVNDQMELGLLLATTGVVAGLIFAPALLHLFYSDKFRIGESMIRWQFLGVGLRVLGWPMAYVLVGKAMGKTYVLIQAVFHAMTILFMVMFVQTFGFNGLGIDYFLAYIFYTLMVAVACRIVAGFRLSTLLRKILLVSIALQTASALVAFFLPITWSFPVGAAILLGLLAWSLRVLKYEMGIDSFSVLRRRLKLES
jgi:PST family polysaccharide transporter